jgi:hypothetical protein
MVFQGCTGSDFAWKDFTGNFPGVPACGTVGDSGTGQNFACPCGGPDLLCGYRDQDCR